MERTGHGEIPSDIIVDVGHSSFPLHKLMLLPKSGYIRRKVMEAADPTEVARIDLSELPGGAEAFDLVAKFCYGVNFEISVNNVSPLLCAAEYLEMTEEHCKDNLARRTEEFLVRAAIKTLPGAVAVLRSCESLRLADELRLVDRCVDAISLKACKEASFPTRSPPEWWAAELAALGAASFQKVLSGMRARSASPKALATAIIAYVERSLPHLFSGRSTAIPASSAPHHCAAFEATVALLPPDCDVPLPVGFLSLFLRAAIAVSASANSRRELERRISAALEQATVADLLAVALDPATERVSDLDSARRIVAGFVERQTSPSAAGGGLFYGSGAAPCSAAVHEVARTVDAFVGEIATDDDLAVSKFVGIAGAIPKSARRLDDDLYRAIDIYLKAHPGLDEIEREKVCSVMDPLKLSYEARLHVAQNKRLPLQIVLSALYYDQLKLRSGGGGGGQVRAGDPAVARGRVKAAGASLARENDALRSELARMRVYVSELERGQGSGSRPGGGASAGPNKKASFLGAVSRTLGKLNPFRNGSKDTSNIIAGAAAGAVTQPRRRRFSMS